MQTDIDRLIESSTESGALKAVSVVVCNSEGLLYEGASGETGGEAMSVDRVAPIYSMTKAITGAAAMQQVEQGKLDLDAPAGDTCPFLGEVKVLDGFDDDGSAILRTPSSPVTLKNLLTHTSGFVYDLWNEDINNYNQKYEIPSILSLAKSSLETPLAFDPGNRWEYGIGIDWAGQMIEAASGQTLGEYFTSNLTGPLGMSRTGFSPTDQMHSIAPMRMRMSDGSLIQPEDDAAGGEAHAPEFESGGGGLLSTASDYSRFVRMILRGGELDGNRYLSEETIDQMASNQIGDLRVSTLKSTMPDLSNDAEFFPGDPKSWGLTFQINEVPGFTGRPAGTLMWAGLCNSFFWIDRENDIGGVMLTQVLPFADEKCLNLLYDIETAVYRSV